MLEVKHSKPLGFHDQFVRKGGDPETTHYCPGCGHGVLHKLIAESVVELGVQDRTILVNPVGCAVFAYDYLDVGNVQAAHGRAPAVATGIKRTRPDSIVLSYQGDGDLAAIGGNEILHAANRGEDISVFFVNNGIYGMTGGQMAPTTPLGMKTVTSPEGRSVHGEGYPIRVCELLATLEAPVYIERVALTDAKHTMRARKAVRRAIQNQVEGRGFSLVEFLSSCPTGWRVTPLKGIDWLEGSMVSTFPLGVFRDRKTPPASPYYPDSAIDIGQVFSSDETDPSAENPGAIARRSLDEVAMKISGFGGQGILFLGMLLAEAGIKEGLRVSWIPSYGAEIRGGTAHCHVRLATQSIASPLINRPSVVLAFNDPSVERFCPELMPGGFLVVNSSMAKAGPQRPDIRVLRVPATEVARDLGEPRVANLVMLGAYLGETEAVGHESVLEALRAHGMSQDLLKLNRAALIAGQNYSQ